MADLQSSLLEVRSVHKAFAGVTALLDVSFAVHGGEIKGVIGPNGAGKSTLFNVITSAIPADRGEVRLYGERITGLPSHRIARRGVSRTFQNVRLFAEQSVIENVAMGAFTATTSGLFSGLLGLPGASRERSQMQALARQCLEFVGLAHLANADVTALSFGQQRLVEISRALASAPKLLLLDEPAAGLNDAETEALADLIRMLPKRGITVLLVEHNMNLMMSVADSIVVLNFGTKLAEGTPKEITADRSVISAYLGEEEPA